jgi:outer membrane immunogenic protein
MRCGTGSVAASSQLRIVVGLAPPRSNQIDATLFLSGCMSNKGTAMNRLLLSTAAILALVAPAVAADLPARTYKAPPATAPALIYNWTGFYIGGHLGGGLGGGNSIQGTGGRFLGGLEGGADYQFAPNWVVGAEAQYSWLGGNNNGRLFPGGNLVTMNDNQLGSVTGRVGYTWGPGLLYAKGGYAFKDNNNLRVTKAGVPQAFTTTGNNRNGYTVGAGVEYMFAPSWSAKVEYQYYDFGNTTFTTGPVGLAGTRIRDDEHTVKAGLNYRFGWGGPMATKY